MSMYGNVQIMKTLSLDFIASFRYSKNSLILRDYCAEEIIRIKLQSVLVT
jgi:hypothetical protein